jgi:(p)ppGpp synthase/HD superfamily hydrolase
MTPDIELILYGMRFAYQHHARQYKKFGGAPYMAHLLSVAALVTEYGGDSEQIVAGALHDCVEDTPVSLEMLENAFNPRIRRIVEGCSDWYGDGISPKPDWKTRKKNHIEKLRNCDADVALVCGCDKLDNMQSLIKGLSAEGHDIYKLFKGGRDGTLWYYSAALYAIAPKMPEKLKQDCMSTYRHLAALDNLLVQR